MTVAAAPADAEPLTDAEVAAWRTRFPILSRCTYLINNSLGAMPASVRDSLAEYAAVWSSKGVQAWDSDWLPQVREVAALLGGLMGAPQGSVVVHQNVATLTSMVLSTLELSGPRNRMVLSADEWPGHHYLFEGCRGLGAEIVVVPSLEIGVDLERLLVAIDERTAFVVISHVAFRSACIADVAAVAARAREVGALCMVDGYHAVGHLPVDVTAIDCDFYVGGSVKWLCGGPGVGYLYIRPELAPTLRPREVGWLGHHRPFGFEAAWEAAPQAMGWLGGTPAVPSLYAAREGYKIVARVTPARIRATSRRLTARLVAGAQDLGVAVRTPLDADHRGGTVTLDLGEDTEAASQRLIDAGIIVDYRPGAGIRVGAHFFNTIEECDRLLDTLRSTVEGSGHR
ncbi:MAG: aminotransferase class V-fold PLP-dependent enzyme [Actinomycetota bacterium]|nr:aminotransferase class V-fold PLP-dependent enzyme [Actinomycetota bacterium]